MPATDNTGKKTSRDPVGFVSDSKKKDWVKIWSLWELNSGSQMIEGKESTSWATL
jgi:hypothetical protein